MALALSLRTPPVSLPTEPAQVPQGVPVPQGVSMERERIPVQVPLGTAAGATMSVPHPRGAFTVMVPHGVPPGGTFWCELAPSVGLPVPHKSFLRRSLDSLTLTLTLTVTLTLTLTLILILTLTLTANR